MTKDDQEIKVLKESAKVWERNGWTVADDGSSEEQDASTAPKSAKKTTTKEG